MGLEKAKREAEEAKREAEIAEREAFEAGVVQVALKEKDFADEMPSLEVFGAWLKERYLDGNKETIFKKFGNAKAAAERLQKWKEQQKLEEANIAAQTAEIRAA